MENYGTHNGHKAAETAAMTYGMSDELLQSDLLERIDRLSISDRQCLIRMPAFRPLKKISRMEGC